MNRIQLKEIIIDQQKTKPDKNIIDRDISNKIESYIENSFVIVLSGIRRSGKSTLLYQIRQNHPGYYLNFDDERLVNFVLEDFQVLYEVFIELFGDKIFFYFDEIQNVKGWERFVRRLHDERKKVFVTGSNASMLSKELGTHLTGRYLEITLYPFSFREFLKLKGQTISEEDIYLTEKRARLRGYFEEYLISGGLPEYLLTANKEYLKVLYESILYRDIIVRYKLPNERTLRELVYLIANNVANEISFNSIKKTLQLGSPTTVKEYFNYFENSFLIFLVAKFDYSLKKQIYSSKKVYLIDNALGINLGFRMSKDSGRLLENLVFIELKRRKKEAYYYSNKKECDFVIKDGIKISEAIQVCHELNEENRQREIEGLMEAMNKFKLKTGLILTEDRTEEIIIDKKKINVIPVFRWMLA